jgi:hypothetical protein
MQDQVAATLSPYRLHIALGLTAFAALAMVYAGGSSTSDPQPQVAGPPTLVASANDPIMIEAIRYARGSSKSRAGNNAWSKPKSEGSATTFATPSGSITLSREEIEEANFIYPQLAERARKGSRTEFGQAPDAGFDDNE